MWPLYTSGDHGQRDDVIDDRHGQQKGTQAVGKARPDQRQQSQGERGVRRHRRPPAVGGRRPGVEGQVDQHRHDHAADPCQHGQRHPPPLPQLPHVELAAGLQADHEEEQCHQAAVQPSAQVEVDRVVAQPHDQVGLPDAAVRRRVDVDPEQRCDRGQQQHAGAAGLGAYELTKRRLQVARPGGLAGERPGAVGRVGGHAALCPGLRGAPAGPASGSAPWSLGGSAVDGGPPRDPATDEVDQHA